jgi:predicted metal-dependent hydrolase
MPGADEPAPQPLRVGVHLFNAGEFFECHEILEELWRAEPRPIRELYQGILQVGVGFYHLGRGNFRGAVNLLGYGLARLSRVPPGAHGLDVAALINGATRCRERLIELGPERIGQFDGAMIPKVLWLPRSTTAER